MTRTASRAPMEAALLLAPVEETSSFLRGSAFGPEAVAQELADLEPYDAELGRGLGERAFARREQLAPAERGLPGCLPILTARTAALVDDGFFVLTLGGEHTVTLGPLQALRDRWPKLGLVQLDAHGDLRQSYEGRPWSHACTMCRAVEEHDLPLLGIGVRSLCLEETERAEENTAVRHLPPWQLRRSLRPVETAVAELPDQVYVSIDMDVFDPSVAPGVGTPEAGGLTWSQVSRILDIIGTEREIVGGDIVELAPPVEGPRTLRLAARVAVRLLLAAHL